MWKRCIDKALSTVACEQTPQQYGRQAKSPLSSFRGSKAAFSYKALHTIQLNNGLMNSKFSVLSAKKIAAGEALTVLRSQFWSGLLAREEDKQMEKKQFVANFSSLTKICRYCLQNLISFGGTFALVHDCVGWFKTFKDGRSGKSPRVCYRLNL